MRFTYKEASKLAIEAGCKGQHDYYAMAKHFDELPSAPDKVYKKEWTNWYDFLGKTKKEIIPYEKAKRKVRKAGIKSGLEYEKKYKKYKGLPSDPHKTYTEWVDWYEFLGVNPPWEKYLPYEEAKKILHPLKFKRVKDFKKFSKSSKYKFPSYPPKSYLEWKGWRDFLGESFTTKCSSKGKKRYVSYTDFKPIFKKFMEDNDLNSMEEYKKAWSKSLGIPKDPYQYYLDEWEGLHKILGVKRGKCKCCSGSVKRSHADVRRERGLREERVTLLPLDRRI